MIPRRYEPKFTSSESRAFTLEMPTRIFYGWWIVLAGFLLSFYISSIVFFGFTAFFEPLVKEFGWSYTEISFAASLRGLEMGLFAPLFGYLVDRYGTRKITFLGIISASLGLFLLSSSGSLPMFYLSFLVVGMGAGACTSVVTMTAVANWFSKNVGKAMGILSAGFGASGLMVPAVVWLIDTQGWRGAIFILGVFILIMGIPLAFVMRTKPETYGYLPDGAEPAAVPGQGITPPAQEYNQDFREVVRTSSFWYINITEGLRLMALAAVVIHIMPYLSTLGIPRTKAGFVAAGLPLISIVGRFGLGWLGDRMDKRHVIAWGHGFMALGIVALFFIHLEPFLYLFLFLFSVGFGGIAALRGALIREYYGRDSFGKFVGITLGSGSLGGVLGPIIAGLVYDLEGNYWLAWVIFFIVLIISLFLTLRIKRPDRKTPPLADH